MFLCGYIKLFLNRENSVLRGKTRLNSKMKYYLYISDTKIDMLYPQIPKHFLQKIASELNINLKLLTAEFNAKITGNQANETRYDKVKLVSKYIEENLDVGTAIAASTYIKGKCLMNWEMLKARQDLGQEDEAVMFGGWAGNNCILLGGSAKHVIGHVSKNTQESYSFLPSLFQVLRANGELGEKNTSLTIFEPPEIRLHRAMQVAISVIDNMQTPYQQLEFLAKTLVQGPVKFRRGEASSVNVVIATPIYVAIDD